MADEMELDNELDETEIGHEADEQESSDRQPPVNLDELEDFRRWKSSMDKQISQKDKMLADMQNRMSQIEREREQQLLANMDEMERARYDAKKAAEYAYSLEQQLRQTNMMTQRQKDLLDIAQTVGVTVEEIDNPEWNLHETWKNAQDIARKKRAGGGKQKQSEQTQGESERSGPPRVDTGQGTPPSKATDLQRLYDAAMKNYDTGAALDIMARAAEVGVQLRE